MTLSFIIGPIIALVIFIIFITDKWEVVMHGSKEQMSTSIYKKHEQLQKQNVRCKIVREDGQLSGQSLLKLLVMEKDIHKLKGN